MKLNESQKKVLRGLGHQLKPIVLIGDAGLTESVLTEFLAALKHHELLKVRVRTGDREIRDRIIGELCDRGSAGLVARTGNVALLFRQNEDKPRITMPQN